MLKSWIFWFFNGVLLADPVENLENSICQRSPTLVNVEKPRELPVAFQRILTPCCPFDESITVAIGCPLKPQSHLRHRSSGARPPPRIHGRRACMATRPPPRMHGRSSARPPPHMYGRSSTAAHAWPLVHRRACMAARPPPHMHGRSSTAAHAWPLISPLVRGHSCLELPSVVSGAIACLLASAGLQRIQPPSAGWLAGVGRPLQRWLPRQRVRAWRPTSTPSTGPSWQNN